MAKRARVGDIVEIQVKGGYAYAIFSHYHEGPPRYGALLRIMEGLFPERLSEVGRLAYAKEKFAIFFPLQAALSKGLVNTVGHVELPDHLKPFPVFKRNMNHRARASDSGWRLWDGKREWPVERLNEEQKHYPNIYVVNDTALREMIEDGYEPSRGL